MPKKGRLPRKKGFSLVEVVVALGAIAIAFGSLAVFSGRTVAAAVAARQDLVAAQLALEGVEFIRNFREENWINGRVADSTGITCGSGSPPDATTGTWRQGLCNRPPGGEAYRIGLNPDGSVQVFDDAKLTQPKMNPLLRFDSATGVYGYGAGGMATPYRRAIALSNVGDDEMVVRVFVWWCPTEVPDCDAPRSLVVEDHLRNWVPH